MARNSTVTTKSSATSTSQSTGGSRQQSQSKSQQTSQRVVDQKLLSQILAGLADEGYTPRTEAQLQQAAQDRYEPIYNAEVEAAKQLHEKSDLALSQQLDEVLSGIERQKQTQNAAYDRARANIETAALGRGMGRSSYTTSTLANNDIARARALESIDTEASRKANQIAQQRAQLAGQLSQTLGRLSTDRAKKVTSYLQDLYDQEYSRRKSAAEAQNQNYLTAMNMSMGTQTTGSQSTESDATSWSSQKTDSSSSDTKTTSYGGTSSARRTGTEGGTRQIEMQKTAEDTASAKSSTEKPGAVKKKLKPIISIRV